MDLVAAVLAVLSFTSESMKDSTERDVRYSNIAEFYR